MTATASADETGAMKASRAAAPLSFAPAPGAAPASRMILAQAGHEVRLMLRNPEQLLLTIVIPALMMVLFSGESLIATDGPGKRIDFYTPGLFGAAVLSTAFTGLAIGTGFERRYGVLKRMGATPLPRWGLVVAKALCVLCVEAIQIALLSVIALAMGWQPHGDPLAVVLLVVLATGTFAGLGLLMAGTLRAEATLGLANFVFLLLLAGGGVIIPLSKFPSGVRPVLDALPITALTNGLRDVLQHGATLPWANVGILAAWAVAAIAAAARTFKWE
ncbi:ABC transporter permease [Catenulispora yoronensis]|uniref:Transport permease protein n=2 Tax=Catenulispora yoronensis TaxID=450799 RepID=A0ABP5FH11_9ACTN